MVVKTRRVQAPFRAEPIGALHPYCPTGRAYNYVMVVKLLWNTASAVYRTTK